MYGDSLIATLVPVAAAQVALAARVVRRLMRTARGLRVVPSDATLDPDERISVLVPVLNEYARLAPCLDGLLTQGPEVAEMLVIDGGSTDGTQSLVARYAARDSRMRLIDASPVPLDWNGKTWGLDTGLRHASRATRWVLTIDADVRPAPPLAHALLAHARHTGDAALSVATRQHLSGAGEALIHPALLTTLIYRFGSPGHRTGRVEEMQANGQCMLLRRDLLDRYGGFAAVRESICEDITLARMLASNGVAVGFYEAGDLVAVNMYGGARDAWRNWSRSLPLRDRYFGIAGVLGLLEVALVQALPLPLLIVALALGTTHAPSSLWLLAYRLILAVEGLLVALRLGVLAGTARAYSQPQWTYWLSPMLDLPVACKLVQQALRRRHSWRGRVLLRGGTVSV